MWFSPLLIGLSLGILGGGGSILVVPILTYLFKIDPKTAIAYSLLIVGLTSLFGVIQNLKNIEYKKIILFSLLAFFGTFIGTKIAFLISSQIQMILFSLIISSNSSVVSPSTFLSSKDSSIK